MIYGTTEGNAAGARGHMDCTEIVKEQAISESLPVVRVSGIHYYLDSVYRWHRHNDYFFQRL